MMENQNRRGIAIAVIVILALGGVIATKTLRTSNKETSATVSHDSKTTNRTAYLFMNANDQDSGCSKIYSLFDELSSKLPADVKTEKVDVNGPDQSIFKRLNVLVLPTVLFLNDKGEVQNRIEGEGEEVEAKIRNAFEIASQEASVK